MKSSKNLLIYIVAYNAESTICDVLRRIPVDALPQGTEILVSDDASADATAIRARTLGAQLGPFPLTVRRNDVNLGYGGNQKVGYRFAIEEGFRAVALLHGDGQYAPEELPRLAQPVLAKDAAACFGSRMAFPWRAVKEGMPLYKYIGNRILTVFQNIVLGTCFSEFHSGYRVYSVAALQCVPFHLNSNGFHFDTEIIIQFLLNKLPVKELPIPTFYGEEVCYVNGLAYAWNVVRTTLISALHQQGFLDVPRYRDKGALRHPCTGRQQQSP